MEDVCRYADHPLAFLGRYIGMRRAAHGAIMVAVMTAVACSVGAQYGVKLLVDILAGGPSATVANAWLGFLLLVSLIGADNLLWRLPSRIPSPAFVPGTGALRAHFVPHPTPPSPP